MVIFEIGLEYALELLFMEDDHSIQAFSTNGTYEALDIWVLPRGSWRDQFLLDAHALDALYEHRASLL